MKQEFIAARRASSQLLSITSEQTNSILLQIAHQAQTQAAHIIERNKLDLARMSPDDPRYDRLRLTRDRIDDIASEIRNVATLPTPYGHIIEQNIRPNGITINRVSVPFGVIGIIYEARPNVSFDCFSLCFKAGSAVILKGSTDASESNKAIVALIREVLERNDITPDIVTLLSPERDSTTALLNAVGYVDLVIPRGSQGLINFVRDNARVPVIETGAGVCHTYFDLHGNAQMASEIVFNAKTRRPSVCNTLDSLVIHSSRLSSLVEICAPLADKQVIIYADEPSYNALNEHYPYLERASADHFGTEFLAYKMSIKTVSDLTGAIDHISRYSSKHSEAIITDDSNVAHIFTTEIDAACVYHNCSTAFTDGAQFGLGAEIGISTQKLHARGPMALRELTTYKYIIYGQGQIRI